MLKYHVAVCDDEKSDLDGIVQSVQQYDVQGCFDIETYMDGNELLSELQMQKKSFDLLLLDIEMSLLKSCIQRHWKCWNLPALNLSLKKRNPFPCPHHKQKNFGAIMYRTSL